MTPPLIILAGGKGSRMGPRMAEGMGPAPKPGCDKGMIDVAGVRLIDRVYGRVKDQVQTVMISGAQDYGLGVRVIADIVGGPAGPAAGLYAAWQILGGRVAGFFTVPVDGPDVPRDLCARLYHAQRSQIVLAGGRVHPTFAWWRQADLDGVFAGFEGEGISLRHLAKRAKAAPVTWADADPDANAFLNLNTRSDVADYARRLRHD